ncbi:hypothetical protein BpHYR1_038198 [Brachionus plicatilis]|uniref:Uncharacterized protein n=1 Tax=Brachionus plicatilis TaxID=10195 RepID=A0A3M7T9T8_BRAPC|nr:hypothetical protein BpHYR1_038198 [Brachionus plicatilis]
MNLSKEKNSLRLIRLKIYINFLRSIKYLPNVTTAVKKVQQKFLFNLYLKFTKPTTAIVEPKLYNYNQKYFVNMNNQSCSQAKTISIGQKRKRSRPKKQKAALFYSNDCDLSNSENESDPEQAVVEQEPPSDSVIEKEYFAEATVQATVDLPRKRGRPKKSITQGKILKKLISAKTNQISHHF